MHMKPISQELRTFLKKRRSRSRSRDRAETLPSLRNSHRRSGRSKGGRRDRSRR